MSNETPQASDENAEAESADTADAQTPGGDAPSLDEAGGGSFAERTPPEPTPDEETPAETTRAMESDDIDSDAFDAEEGPAPVPAGSHAAAGEPGTRPIFDDDAHRIDEVPVDEGEPEPAVEASGFRSDATDESVAAAPVVAASAAAGPVVAEPAVAAPPVVEPAVAEPAVAEPAVAEPAVAEPVVAEAPSDVEPVVEQPVEAAPAAPVQPVPVYVAAPTPPKDKGNRLMGILIGVVATVVFAVVFAAVLLGLFALRAPRVGVATWEHYLPTAGFWVPVVVFFLAFALLVAIVNRGGWWAYVLGSFFVGVIVYFAYIGGALLTVQAWTLSLDQANQFIGTLWVNPLTIASAIVAREVALWFGAWVAARGRRVRERNLEAQREYDQQLAAGPAN